MIINSFTKAVMQSPQRRNMALMRTITPCIKIMGTDAAGLGEVGVGLAVGGCSMVASVGDVRYSLLCVHWAQCKGDLTRAGDAPRRSPAGPTWTLTCARIQASGPISATRVSNASRRSPA